MSQIIEYHILDTGYCQASEHHILQGGEKKKVQIHALVGLLRHPTQGWLLFDTGYAPRMQQATDPWPFLLYRLATPFQAPPELAVIQQLKRFGLEAADIRHIVVSHFHSDHVAGLLDFPKTHFICSQAGYADVVKRKGLHALQRAFIPSLIPNDFATRATFIERFNSEPLPGLGFTQDIFGDRSLQLILLPGHAHGQVGMLANTVSGPVLFAADGAWYRRAIREQRPPAQLTRLFVDDLQAVKETINRLHEFNEARPEVRIIPTHCPEAYAEIFV